MDPVAGPAKAAQVLRPSGRLAVFGHVFAPPPPVAEAFAAAYRHAAPDSPLNHRPSDSAQSAVDVYRAMFAKAADGIRQACRFDEPEQW